MPVDEFQTARAFVSPVPVTGFVIVFCLLLNVVQSVADKVPVAEAEATGIFTVIEFVEVEIYHPVPDVEVAIASRERTLV